MLKAQFTLSKQKDQPGEFDGRSAEAPKWHSQFYSEVTLWNGQDSTCSLHIHQTLLLKSCLPSHMQLHVVDSKIKWDCLRILYHNQVVCTSVSQIMQPLDNLTRVLLGARFTNVCMPEIKIRWKLRLVITALLAIRSQLILAHGTTAHGIRVEVRVKLNFNRI